MLGNELTDDELIFYQFKHGYTPDTTTVKPYIKKGNTVWCPFPHKNVKIEEVYYKDFRAMISYTKTIDNSDVPYCDIVSVYDLYPARKEKKAA